MAITYPVRAVRYLIAASLLGWSHAQPGDLLTGMSEKMISINILPKQF